MHAHAHTDTHTPRPTSGTRTRCRGPSCTSPRPRNVVIPPSDCSLAPDPKASCQCPEPRDRLLSATSRALWKLIRVSRSPMGRAWWLRLCSLGLGVPLGRSLTRGCHLQLPGALGFCEHAPGTTGGRGVGYKWEGLQAPNSLHNYYIGRPCRFPLEDDSGPNQSG